MDTEGRGGAETWGRSEIDRDIETWRHRNMDTEGNGGTEKWGYSDIDRGFVITRDNLVSNGPLGTFVCSHRSLHSLAAQHYAHSLRSRACSLT